ncbi:DNA-binding protein [Flammeovirga pectinis]|uniref:DNA-binding protein n=1 Tax=Flammeovirga pectinis TaxID=2494373 RepID=A0A3S9P9M0_9BACT|nr:OB-fold nucleic acid binding domain-containing protein [Flammeovirga pectinis]AZQ64877.1 DNA-binding protein [Flammeovirga pectinis]
MKIYIAFIVASLSFLASCNTSEQTNSNEGKSSSAEVINSTITEEVLDENTHKVVVKEKIASGGYIYIKVSEKGNEYWMAVPGRQIEIGATYYYDGGMEMRNFESKTLNRTFESVIFSEGIRDTNKGVAKTNTHSNPEEKTSVDHIEKAPNGISVAELFENPKSYLNKQVIIKGKVVKVNNGVMKVNFVHLQDGSIGNGKYDITITTNDTFKVGEVVTIKGTVTLDKDFGSGYVYDVLVEKAVII